MKGVKRIFILLVLYFCVGSCFAEIYATKDLCYGAEFYSVTACRYKDDYLLLITDENYRIGYYITFENKKDLMGVYREVSDFTPLEIKYEIIDYFIWEYERSTTANGGYHWYGFRGRK